MHFEILKSLTLKGPVTLVKRSRSLKFGQYTKATTDYNHDFFQNFPMKIKVRKKRIIIIIIITAKTRVFPYGES